MVDVATSNVTDLSSYVPLVHDMPGKPLKQNLEKFKVIPNNCFWGELEYSKVMRCAVQPSLDI